MTKTESDTTKTITHSLECIEFLDKRVRGHIVALEDVQLAARRGGVAGRGRRRGRRGGGGGRTHHERHHVVVQLARLRRREGRRRVHPRRGESLHYRLETGHGLDDELMLESAQLLSIVLARDHPGMLLL